MSHFSAIQTNLIDKQALIEGLQTLFKAHNLAINVEVHDSPTRLISNYSSSDFSEAEIIIRSNQLKHNQRDALLDVGFAYDQENHYFEAIIDSWDFNRNCLGYHFDTVQQFLNQVQLAHDQAYINLHYPSDIWHHQVTELEDGTIRTTISRKQSLVEAYI
jgi:hypothetical protein